MSNYSNYSDYAIFLIALLSLLANFLLPLYMEPLRRNRGLFVLSEQKRELSLAELHLKQKTKRLQKSLYLLSFCLLLIVINTATSQLIPDPEPLVLSVVLCFFLVAILLNMASLNYRIKKGFFGTSDYEAREFIDYILANSKDGDLPKDGKRKTLIDPEELTETASVGKFKGATS